MDASLLALVRPVQEAAEGAGPASPFEVNFGLFFWTWVVFLGLFLVLRRFAWPVILRSTEERERRIRMQLEEAERANAEARALLEEHRRLIAGAREQAHQLLAEAKAVAEREREAILAKTRQEQEQLLERTRREIAAEQERARQELKREVVDLALAAAAKLIEQRLDGEADRRLVREFLASVGKGA